MTSSPPEWAFLLPGENHGFAVAYLAPAVGFARKLSRSENCYLKAIKAER